MYNIDIYTNTYRKRKKERTKEKVSQRSNRFSKEKYIIEMLNRF